MQKTDVKVWLKAIGKNRQWLAEQCGVTKRGVDAWLSSSRPIPRPQKGLSNALCLNIPLQLVLRKHLPAEQIMQLRLQ